MPLSDFHNTGSETKTDIFTNFGLMGLYRPRTVSRNDGDGKGPSLG